MDLKLNDRDATDTLPFAAPSPATDYARDAMERGVLFLDALRRRGNNDLEHAKAGVPPLLKFDHELVIDGSTLAEPCNYALLQIVPRAGIATDPKARPVVVVDPRAGHGPGIGGFKQDSEIGVALRDGHPVYFVTFAQQPVDGQSLLSVARAEAFFLETVAARHPQAAARPVVIGNCQAGWAMAGLAAMRPELFGALVLVGSPLSYWAGSSRLNPMRYSGAVLGGAWLAALTADLGADRFDGAHLVKNFENLNPANTHWGRYYRLWSKVDTEADRFLEFERWWGGYFRMSGSEIEAIVENLFVGNRLARGEVQIEGRALDLRNISSPIVVFASWGDNITPPPQALNWIIDCWGDERAIAAAGRVIVYVLHESVGHLGIFVGAEIARKEHDQIVTSLDVIENLPPGLYEMKLRSRDIAATPTWHDLETGAYGVRFEHRTMDDLRAVNPEGRDEERLFSTVAKLSEINLALYRTWVRPWLRPLATRSLADAATHLHPLRSERRMLSDANPALGSLAALAEGVRNDRHAVPHDHPMRQVETAVSEGLEAGLNFYRDLRDQGMVQLTRMMFGPLGFGAWLPPERSDEDVAVERAGRELEAARTEVLERIGDGGFARAVCRIVLAAMVDKGAFERRTLRLAHLLALLPALPGEAAPNAERWHGLVCDEARIRAVAPEEALAALPSLLPDTAACEHALAVAEAVLMVEPGLPDPSSPVVAELIDRLGADPARVMDLALAVTCRLAPVAAADRRKIAPLGFPERRKSRRLPETGAKAEGIARTATRSPT